MGSRNSATHLATIEVIADLREAAGISQRELSQRLSRPHNYAYLVESGQRMLNFADLIEYLQRVDGVDLLDALKTIVDRSRRPSRKPRTFGKRGPRPQSK